MTRLETIKTILEANSSASWRIEQIKEAIFSDKISRYSQISNLPKSLKEQLSNTLGDEILSLKLIHEVRGQQALKVLFETRDGHLPADASHQAMQAGQIESVRLLHVNLIRYNQSSNLSVIPANAGIYTNRFRVKPGMTR